MKSVNQTSQINILTMLQRHDFVSFPKRIDGSRLAIRNYSVQGIFCCDLLVYREIKGAGETLSTEATLLAQTLSTLQTELCNHPHKICSNIQNHVINFLGKKAYIFTNNSDQPLHCRILPLLILNSNIPFAVQDKPVLTSSTPKISTPSLDEYIAHNFSKSSPKSYNPQTVFRLLQKSYRYKGLVFILLPLLIGLSGILWGVGLSILALFSLLGGLLGTLVLIQKARSRFTQFCQKQTIPILTPVVLTMTAPTQKAPKPSLPQGDEIQIPSKTNSAQNSRLQALQMLLTLQESCSLVPIQLDNTSSERQQVNIGSGFKRPQKTKSHIFPKHG